MMFPLKYGRSEINISIDTPASLDFLERNEVPAPAVDSASKVRLALKRANPDLNDFLSSVKTLAVIVSDQTRPTGSEIYMPILLEEFKRAGLEDVTIIIAQGLHLPATEAEIETILGGPVPPGVRVINHDPDNNLKKCGDAFFRREAVEAEAVIITGSVIFHPMAGYSGGRKSLLPGIASRDDIYCNHRLYFDGIQQNPGCGPGLAGSNPVRNDLSARTRGFDKLWALNVVMGESKNIIFASCGDADAVWESCADFVYANYSVSIAGEYDTVISTAGGYPSDYSFYQSMKVLTNSARACREGGRLIIFTECSMGWEINERLLSLFTISTEEIAKLLIEDFRMDVLAMYMALKIISSYEVWLYSSLPRAEVESAGMHYLGSTAGIEALAAEGRAAVIKNGSSILPVAKKLIKEAR